jgi:hypothetical protein
VTQFSVDHVDMPPKQWNNKDGHPMVTYKMRLSEPGQPGQVQAEWNRKPDSPAPQVGQMLDGNLEDGQYGKKFKPATQSFGGGGGKSYEADPKKSANVAMGDSQRLAWHMACYVFENNLEEDAQQRLLKFYGDFANRLFHQRKKAMDDAA